MGPEGSSGTGGRGELGALGEGLGAQGLWEDSGRGKAKTHIQVQDVRIGAVLEEGLPVFQGQMAM